MTLLLSLFNYHVMLCGYLLVFLFYNPTHFLASADLELASFFFASSDQNRKFLFALQFQS